MGSRLRHHHTLGGLPAQVTQSHVGEISVRVGIANASSRIQETPRSKRAHFVGLGLEFLEQTRCSRIERGFGSQLRPGNDSRRALSSKTSVWSSASLAGRNGGCFIVACWRSCWKPDSLWRSDRGRKNLRRSLVVGASFQQLFWDGGGSFEANDSLVIVGGGDHGGAGNGGGGGGDGSDGSSGKDGNERKMGEEIFIKNKVEKEGADEEDQVVKETPIQNLDFRPPVLASLSSVAGNAFDGEVSFGELLLGRSRRDGSAEEVDARLPSRNFFKDTTNSSGGTSRKENEQDALVQESTAQAAQLLHQNDGDEAHAMRSEAAALRRLQREAFADLLRVKERLDKLEYHTGLRTSKGNDLFGEGGSGTKLRGKVSAGGAFVFLDDECSRYSRAALEQAGLHTGLDVRFTFETSYRERDVMTTECSAGHSGSDGSILGGPVSVTKLVYNAQVTDNVNIMVAPLGARGSDVTETVNPLQGHALTQFARIGPAMYHDCVGSALGATLRGKAALISLTQFLSGWGTEPLLSDGPVHSRPLCLSTLAHIMFQPWESSVFSLSAVNRFWPSPPLPSFRGLHWSEMGPLVLSKSHHSHKNSGSISPPMSSPRDFRISMDSMSVRDHRTLSDIPSGCSANASWGTIYGELGREIITIPETHGSAMQSIAVAGEIDVGANVSLAGWAQADREYWLQESENKEIEWGVSLTKTVGTTTGWGLCVGTSKVDLWDAARNEDPRYMGAGDGLGGPCDTQLQMEAFLRLNMGSDFTLQPGLVYLLNKQSQTPALVLRSSWALRV